MASKVGWRAVALIPMFVLASAHRLWADDPCCGPITPGGQRLESLLDSSGVDHLWLAGHHIVWNTGEPDPARPDAREEATHCSAFVAAIAKRLGIYVLRPPEHSQELLASAQVEWMDSDGRGQGWRELEDYVEAQAAANRGELVLEAFENPDPDRPGHIAIVRPSEKSEAELDREGPEETQAGGHNEIDTTTAHGFRQHHGAWRHYGRGSIRYYAHSIAWAALK